MNEANKFKDLSFDDNDLFNRESLAKQLTKNFILDDVSESKVALLDGAWGCGKTHMVRMWHNELNSDKPFDEIEDNIKSIYYNAWEYDNWDDPLIPLLLTLINCETLSQKIKSIGSTISSEILFKGSLIKKGKKIINKFKKFNRYNIPADFKNYIKQRQDLRAFLTELSKDKKIVLFIDELDRCKPLFAIKTLEVLKHLFDVDNFVFILSTDINSLNSSIKKVYGNNIKAERYLRRFYDYKILIPAPNDITKLIDIKLEAINFNVNDPRKQFELKNNFVDSLKSLITLLKLQIRDTQHILDLIFNFIKLQFGNKINVNNIQQVLFYSTLISLKFYNSTDFKKLNITCSCCDKPVVNQGHSERIFKMDFNLNADKTIIMCLKKPFSMHFNNVELNCNYIISINNSQDNIALKELVDINNNPNFNNRPVFETMIENIEYLSIEKKTN